MSAGEEVRPVPTRPATRSTVRRGSYCHAEGWKCTSDARCDEHQPHRDPVPVGGLFARILDGAR